MVTELTKLYNTLSLIETKGENTKTMANCLVYIENLVESERRREAEAARAAAEPEVVEEIPAE